MGRIKKYSSSSLINKNIKKIYKDFKNHNLHELKNKNKLERELMFINYLKDETIIKREELEYYFIVLESYKNTNRNIMSLFYTLYIPFLLSITLLLLTNTFTSVYIFLEKSYEIQIQSNPGQSVEQKIEVLKQVLNNTNMSMFDIIEKSTYQILAIIFSVILILWSVNKFYKTRIPIDRMIKSVLKL